MAKTIGPGNEDVQTAGRTDYFRPKEGETYRVGLCWAAKDEDGNFLINKDNDAKFLFDQVYYLESSNDYGYVVSNPYLEDKFSEPPSPRLGTVVVLYPEADANAQFKKDDDGNPKLNPSEWKVMPWVFGRDKYNDLSNVDENFPLLFHDLRITCEDEDFQQLDIRVADANEAVWRQNEDLRGKILQKAEQASNEISLAADPDIEQLKSEFGDDEVAPDVAEAPEDYEDALDDIEV